MGTWERWGSKKQPCTPHRGIINIITHQGAAGTGICSIRDAVGISSSGCSHIVPVLWEIQHSSHSWVRKQRAAGLIMDTLCENLALWGLWQDYGRNLDEFWKRSNSSLNLQLPFNFQSCKLMFPSLIFEEIFDSVPELWLTSSSTSSLLHEIWESFCHRKVCVVFLFERDLAVIYNTESLEQK